MAAQPPPVPECTTTTSTTTSVTESSSSSSDEDGDPCAWHELTLPASDCINLRLTLESGQCFQWEECEQEGGDLCYSGVVDNAVVILGVAGGAADNGAMDSRQLKFKVVAPTTPSVEFVAAIAQKLREYLRLDTAMGEMLQSWCRGTTLLHSMMRTAAPCFSGLRLLCQDPVECLFSFICSQNNNISRITSMLTRLRAEYGTKIADYSNKSYFTFPTLGSLLTASEEHLREMGFGYRARYIPQAAQQVQDRGGLPWLLGLKSLPTDIVRSELTQLTGVGPKVADCVSLFSMSKLDLVPVDTHVWQIARQCLPSLPQKPTLRDHSTVHKLFRDAFGCYAGWAHSVLFASELPKFQSLKNGRVTTVLKSTAM
ncbi:8-oxoguanine DNA-glycosylase [Pelomyxa schiedti]|nr:8-oxoguanine DNA-glycosylase [Pelomyxa schiedti]